MRKKGWSSVLNFNDNAFFVSRKKGKIYAKKRHCCMTTLKPTENLMFMLHCYEFILVFTLLNGFFFNTGYRIVVKCIYKLILIRITVYVRPQN